MKFQKKHPAPFPMVEIEMAKGEEIKIEPSSMIYYEDGITFDVRFNRAEGGSRLGALVRSAVSGESIFITHATCVRDGAKFAIAAPQAGDILELDLSKGQWKLNDGAFLACDKNVNFKLKKQSLKQAFFAAGGLFVMETTGTGTMLIDTCGAMHRIDLDGSRPFHVDNTHLVAWSADLDYKVNIIGSGAAELNTLQFDGVGSLILQTNCRWKNAVSSD